jgi:cell division protein FtsW (lipid II flippase)
MTKANGKLPGIIRFLFVAAAVWGFLAGLLIFLLPFGSRASAEVTSAGGEKISVTPAYFFETQGWWGIFILIIFAWLYYGPFHFYRRGSRGTATVFAVTAVIVSILAGFSIGPFYLIGALALVLGLLLMPSQNQKRRVWWETISAWRCQALILLHHPWFTG